MRAGWALMLTAVATIGLPGVAWAQTQLPEAAPTIALTPDADLVDHQVVTASGSGFAARSPLQVLQCRSGSNDYDGCMFPSAAFTLTDRQGRFSVSFGISALMPLFGQPRFDCRPAAGTCELVAVDAQGAIATVDLAFDPDAPASSPPSFTVTPNTGLVDGQILDITGSGLRPTATLFLFVCDGEIPAAPTCPTVVVGSDHADIDGNIAIRYRARAIQTVGFDTPIDCRVVHCFLALSKAPWEEDVPMVPLEFDSDAPLLPYPSITVSPSTGLQDGQTVTVTGRDGFAGGAALLEQCPADGTFLDCDRTVGGFVGLGPTGGFSVPMEVKAQLTTIDGDPVDCRVERCEIRVEFADRLAGFGQPTSAPITFGPAATNPPPMPPAAPLPAQPAFAG